MYRVYIQYRRCVRAVLKQVIAALSQRPSPDIDITPLTGGITNTTYRLDMDGKLFVVSIARAGSRALNIDHASEAHNTQQAHQKGIAPQVILYRPGVLVTRFIGGQVLQSGALKSRQMLSRVVQTLKQCHSIPLDRVRGQYSVFKAVTHHLARSQPYQPPYPRNLDAIITTARWIQLAVGQPRAPVFCHNDVIPANMIDTGDGIVLIDWEYAGIGDAYFDLGMLAAYHDLTADEEQALLTAYAGRATPATLARLRLLRVMSDLRDAAWAMLQWALSPLDFDYEAYGRQRFWRFTQGCAQPDFERWLQQAALPKSQANEKEQPHAGLL